MKKIAMTSAISAAILSSLSMPALAHEQGDWIVRGGIALVEPDESSSSLKADGTSLSNTGLGVGNDTQLGITATYMLSDRIGIELLASTPFDHNVTAKGLSGLGVPDGTKIATVEHLPPTLSVQYFFMDSASALQPYAGIGLNYFLILDEDLTSGAESALGASNLNVDHSIGLAFQLGADYALNKNWLVNASIWNIDISTDVSLDTALGEVKADLDIDPWVYMVSVGYKY